MSKLKNTLRNGLLRRAAPWWQLKSENNIIELNIVRCSSVRKSCWAFFYWLLRTSQETGPLLLILLPMMFMNSDTNSAPIEMFYSTALSSTSSIFVVIIVFITAGHVTLKGSFLERESLSCLSSWAFFGVPVRIPEYSLFRPSFRTNMQLWKG